MPTYLFMFHKQLKKRKKKKDQYGTWNEIQIATGLEGFD